MSKKLNLMFFCYIYPAIHNFWLIDSRRDSWYNRGDYPKGGSERWRWEGSEEIVKQQDINGKMAIHWAAGLQGTRKRRVPTLLEMVRIAKRHSLINQKDFEGNTPLMYAAVSPYLSHVRILTRNGAFFDIKNEKGQTAYDLACAKCKKLQACYDQEPTFKQSTPCTLKVSKINDNGEVYVDEFRIALTETSAKMLPWLVKKTLEKARKAYHSRKVEYLKRHENVRDFVREMTERSM